MKTIEIIQQGDRFMAYFVNEKVIIPTPFSPRSHTIGEVRHLLQKKNLDYCVIEKQYAIN